MSWIFLLVKGNFHFLYKEDYQNRRDNFQKNSPAFPFKKSFQKLLKLQEYP